MSEAAPLNLRGVKCPLPIVRLSAAIKQVAAGDTLSFVADDPAFPLDVQAWARRTGHELVRLEKRDGSHYGEIRRAA